MSPKLFSCMATVLLLSACATVEDTRALEPVMPEQGGVASKAAPVPVNPVQGQNIAPAEIERIAPTLIKGSDVMIATPSARGRVSMTGEAVSLHFEQAPVTEVVNAIFGDLLKIDYALVTPLTGEVTLHTHSPVPREQVLPLIESLLQANGIAMVADAGGRYRIGKADALKSTVPLPRRTEALPAGFGSVIVPLQYIGATEMADILRPVATAEAFLRVDTVRNLLMLAGTRNQIDGWLEMINTFDVDFLKGMSVGLFPLTHATVADVDAALKSVLGQPSTAGQAAGGAGALRGAVAATTRGAAQTVQAGTDSVQGLSTGPLSGIVRIIPIERLNALLVVTPRAHYLEQVKIWIERFDRPADSGSEPQLYVYPVQNGSAQHLAQVLGGIFGGSVPQTTSSSGVAPGLRSGSSATSGFGARSSSSSTGTTTGSSTSASIGALNQSSQTQPGVTAVDVGEKIRVVADERNNAILIYGTRAEYNKIEAALKRLDIAPVQVLIQASIVEITLADELKYGLQWHFQSNLGNGWNGGGTLSRNADGSLVGDLTGFSYAVTDPKGVVQALLQALAKKSLVKVISSPSLMVLDNHTAVISVGDQRPIRTGSTTSSESTSTVTNYQYKDIGVALTVTPSVNAGDIVTMQINQNVTDVDETTQNNENPTFMKREVDSKVAVRSGETLVLGGLIRSNNSTGKTGLPVLHDVPVLGHLFGTTDNSDRRTELLVVITPRVVRSDQDIRDVSAEMRARMQGLRNQDDLRKAAASVTQPLLSPGMFETLPEHGGMTERPDVEADVLPQPQ